MSLKTNAICIKVSNLRKNNYENLREWIKNENNILITRRGRIFIDGKIFHYPESKWHNPFKLNNLKNNINEVLRKYLNYLFDSGLIFEIDELKGKNLGCFCEDQYRNNKVNCHAQLLVDLLEKCNDILQKILIFRFIKAQNKNNIGSSYEQVIKELKQGKKTSHWIWYIFPQISGLIENPSKNNKFYSIENKEEAINYLNNDLLRNRLIETNNLMLININKGQTIKDILGDDDKKYISSLTLFYIISKNKYSDLYNLLDKIIKSAHIKLDEKTISLLFQD